jgi:DNA-binding XRE family transcriptional regulator
MNDFEYFGKLVEQAREEKAWSQQRLADEVDVDVRTVKKLESGTGNPPMEVVLKYHLFLEYFSRYAVNHDPCEAGLKLDHIYRELISFLRNNLNCLATAHYTCCGDGMTTIQDVETFEDYCRVVGEINAQFPKIIVESKISVLEPMLWFRTGISFA